MDLTPCYPFLEDVVHFHRALRTACEKHETSYYARFKKWCDEYFVIRHRDETWRAVTLGPDLGRCWDSLLTYPGRGDFLLVPTDPPRVPQGE